LANPSPPPSSSPSAPPPTPPPPAAPPPKPSETLAVETYRAPYAHMACKSASSGQRASAGPYASDVRMPARLSIVAGTLARRKKVDTRWCRVAMGGSEGG